MLVLLMSLPWLQSWPVPQATAARYYLTTCILVSKEYFIHARWTLHCWPRWGKLLRARQMMSISPPVSSWSLWRSLFPSWLEASQVHTKHSWRGIPTTFTASPWLSINCLAVSSPSEATTTLKIDWKSFWPLPLPLCWDLARRGLGRTSGIGSLSTFSSTRLSRSPPSSQWTSSSPASPTLSCATPTTQFTVESNLHYWLLEILVFTAGKIGSDQEWLIATTGCSLLNSLPILSSSCSLR